MSSGRPRRPLLGAQIPSLAATPSPILRPKLTAHASSGSCPQPVRSQCASGPRLQPATDCHRPEKQSLTLLPQTNANLPATHPCPRAALMNLAACGYGMFETGTLFTHWILKI